MKIIGVDPGKNGAYAVIEDGELIEVEEFKQDIRRCRRVFEYRPDAFYIERVHSSPNQGVVSAFTFGKYSEAVNTACILTGRPALMVKPQVWQSTLGCLSGGNKAITYNKAKELFFDMKYMFKRVSADAVLIALYGYKHFMYNHKGGIVDEMC